jgi:hypothetical protein
MTHLTEEEFADYLIGLSTATVRTHLLECGACRDEMESFGASLASFNQSSLAWSREQAAAHPIHIEPKAVPQTTARPVWHAGWAAGLAAVLVFAMVLTHGRGTHIDTASNSPAAAITPAAQPQQEDAAVIADDNQMMTAIDAEISQPEVSPVESFATFRPQPERTPVQDVQHAVRKKS